MAKSAKNPWKKLSSETIYKNKWYTVRRDKVIQPNGAPGEYNVIEAIDGVFILALDKNEDVYLVDKYRYVTDVQALELPAGGVESGENPVTAAQRELREELGLTARTWRKIGEFQGENAYMTHRCHAFIASDLQNVDGADQLVEGIKNVQKMHFDDALQLVKRGDITDSQTMSTLLLAALFLNRL